MISNFESSNCRTDGIDNSNTFVAQNSTGLTGGHVAFQNMQISSADRGFCNFDNGVTRFSNFGLWPIFERFLSGAFVNECFHGGLLIATMCSLLT